MKTVSHSQDTACGPTAIRRLGLTAAVALVVANMIGTGIFTTTGFMVADLGQAQPVLIGWILGGVLALCGAAVYGELGAMMPRVGGEYVYLREAYHPWLGFMSGWISLIAGFSAPIAAAAMAFERYCTALFPETPSKWIALALIAVLTLLHTADVQLGSRVQTFFSALKVVLILGFVGAGMTVGKGDWSHFADAGVGLSSVATGAFAVSLVFVSFSYSGWNAAAYLAGEIRDPARNLPRALLLGTSIVTILYLSLNVLFFYAVPPAELAGVAEVGDRAARALFGDEAGRALSTLIALALVSAVSAMVMAGPRVYTAMAEDGMFPRIFGVRNARGAPAFSVVLQGALAAVFVLVAQLAPLIRYIGFTLSLFAALTVAGAFVLRLREPDRPRPYRTWGWPLTPLLFLILSLWMTAYMFVEKPVESLAGVATIAASGLLYLLSVRSRQRRGGAA